MEPTQTLFIYGNRDSNEALAQYKVIEALIKNNQPTLKIKFIHPKSNWTDLLNEKGKILPLLSLKGSEYNYLTETLSINCIELEVLPTFFETSAFIELLNKNPENTFYFMHGSSNATIQKLYEQISFEIKMRKPKASIFYVEQKPNLKDFSTLFSATNDQVFISPLFFIRGKHIEQDLIQNCLMKAENLKWQVGPTILENNEILLSFLRAIHIMT